VFLFFEMLQPLQSCSKWQPRLLLRGFSLFITMDWCCHLGS